MKKLLLICIIILGIAFVSGCLGGDKATDTRTSTDASGAATPTVSPGKIKNAEIPPDAYKIQKYGASGKFPVKSLPTSILVVDGNIVIKNLKIDNNKISGKTECVALDIDGKCQYPSDALIVTYWKGEKDLITVLVTIGTNNMNKNANFEEIVPPEKAAKTVAATEISFYIK